MQSHVCDVRTRETIETLLCVGESVTAIVVCAHVRKRGVTVS